MQQRTDAAAFAESGAPPWWLRALLWGVPLAIVAFGWIDGGADGAAGGAVAAVIVVLLATLPLEFSFAWYGGVKPVDDRLHVGRRSLPVHALDLSTMTFEGRTGDLLGVRPAPDEQSRLAARQDCRQRVPQRPHRASRGKQQPAR